MKKSIIIISAIIGVLFIIAVIGLAIYNSNKAAVDKNSTEKITIQIEKGTRTEQIVKILKENSLIKNELATKIYMKLNGIKNLQAGKYELSKSMTLEDILKTISSGKVQDETVEITFKEGKNIRWIAEEISKKTNNTEEDVYSLLQDDEYIDELIQNYWFINNNIKNKDIYYPLEGYLYPDTYEFKNADVTVKEIFKKLLDEMDKILTSVKEQGAASGKTIHEILTIASIIELEGNDEESRAGISSVIYNRLKANMSLGSDVTTYYAFKVDMGARNLTTTEINTYNPYNTRGPNMNGKLPVGPIASPSKESIKAALNPTQSSYLYFVADSNGKIYFTKTYGEHQQKIQELRNQGLWYTYE